MLISKQINVYELKEFLLSRSKFLKNIIIFDIYFEEKFEGQVNLGIRLEFQSKTETLTNELIENEIEILKKLIDEHVTSLFT